MLNDVFYYNQNYFIFDKSDNRLYIKSREIEEEPKVFYNLVGFSWLNGRVLNGAMNGKCLIFKGDKEIKAFEIKENLEVGRTGEFKISENNIIDCEVFNENRIATIDTENFVSVIELEFNSEEISIKRIEIFEVEGVKNRKEHGDRVAVDSKNEFLITGHYYKKDSKLYSSSISVFQILNTGKLEFILVFDMFETGLYYMRTLNFYYYYGDELVFIGFLIKVLCCYSALIKESVASKW